MIVPGVDLWGAVCGTDVRKFHIAATLGCIAVAVWLRAGDAHAEPFRARGEASVEELGKEATIDRARVRAVHRARLDALNTALETLQTEIDRAAKKQVFGAADAWTGAYRIVGQSVAGGTVAVELEVDIDLPRLAKRLMPRPVTKSEPLYAAPDVRADGSCPQPDTSMLDQLVARGAVRERGGEPLQLRVRCQGLGPVPHTFVHAARVELTATAGGRTIAEFREPGLGAGEPEAVGQALQRALDGLGAALSQHREGQIELRVESPLPAARVRRLERVIRESVLGVVNTEVVGLAPDGAVVLRVGGQLQADALARRLEALSFPGFSLTIVDVEGTDALTVRLR